MTTRPTTTPPPSPAAPFSPAPPSLPSRLRAAASAAAALGPLLLPLLLLAALAVVPALRGTPSSAHAGAAARTPGPASLVPARHRGDVAGGQAHRAGARDGRDHTAVARDLVTGAPLVQPLTQQPHTEQPHTQQPLTQPAAAAPAGIVVVPAPAGAVVLPGTLTTHVTSAVAGLPPRRGPPARGSALASLVHVHPRPA
jgi:hypothetical protein